MSDKSPFSPGTQCNHDMAHGNHDSNEAYVITSGRYQGDAGLSTLRSLMGETGQKKLKRKSLRGLK